MGWLMGLSFFSGFILATKSYFATMALEPSSVRGTIETIGKILFTDYLLPFELTSFLLLIAVIGIVSLAQGALKTK